MPDPPPEWPRWRRDRMRIAIMAAKLFLIKKKSYDEILEELTERGLATAESNARVGQYVTKGLQFLVDRCVFEKVKRA